MRQYRAVPWLLAVSCSVSACDSGELLSPLPEFTATSTDPGFGQFEANADDHSWVNSYLLAWLSHHVYVDAVASTPPAFSAAFLAVVTPLGLRNISIIKDDLTDTEAVAAETDDAVIVAFRGTETLGFTEFGDVIDLVVDGALLPVGGVHAGLLVGAHAVLPAVRSAIAAAGGKKVWLTGHSLGGALATTTAWLLETGSPRVQVQGVYTYGAPRAFLDVQAAHFNAILGTRSQRWVNARDPVPHLPSYTPHIHMGLGLRLSLPYTHTRRLNNIVPGPAGTCGVRLDDAEILRQDQDWIDLLTWTLGLPALAVIATEALLVSGNLDDHDTKRYMARIYASMPAAQRAYLPEPPAGGAAAGLTSCAEPHDFTPPVVTAEIVGTPGTGGWYTGDVAVSWTITDAESPVVFSSGCGDQLVTEDTVGVTFMCTAGSEGGATTRSVTVRRDATPPVAVAVAATRAPDRNGWYNAPFTATWTAEDATSGVVGCTATPYSGPDTDAGSLPGTCTDAAGNTSAEVAFAFRYDATPPVIALATPAAGADYFLDQQVAAAYHCTDATAGVASCEGPVPSGSGVHTGSFGSHPFVVNAADQAGNTATLARAYTVTWAFDGFRAPVVNLPGVNRARAGQQVVMKWGLVGADGRLLEDEAHRFQVGWSAPLACGSGSGGNDITSSETAGQSGLHWDADTRQYVFVAASSRADAGQCRYFVVALGAGAGARALVSFDR
jgi:hypothetical protein